jgi:hypothetical protein
MQESRTNGEFNTHGNTITGNGRAIRDYENALEELKGFIENRSCGLVHNDNLQVQVNGESEKHAIRALEVELMHPVVQEDGTTVIDEYLITAVVVRGLISIEPADGNEAPSYSSKSSSSSVPPPPPPIT